jgi:CMP-N-acetylneuraminic acid synthetase
MKVVGIIPARAGSKGIVGKNVRLIAGKPLVAWTIEAAKESKLLNNFYVSTDSIEIAKISKDLGADIIDRPNVLASDGANMIDVLKHAIEKTGADVIVLLQPTSPVRNKGLIDECIHAYLNKKADSLATGFMCKYTPWGTLNDKATRQAFKGFFYDDGNVYVLAKEVILSGRKKGKNPATILLDKEQSVEIDDAFDFELAEQILKKRNITEVKGNE